MQLLLPVTLSLKNSKWYPHAIIALDYVPPQGEGLGHYSATTLVGLGSARFYSRVVQKLDQQWISISASRPSIRNSVSSSNNRIRKPECQYFQRGACKFGSDCSFLHSTQTTRNTDRGYNLTLQGRGLIPPSTYRGANSNSRRGAWQFLSFTFYIDNLSLFVICL